MRGLIFAMCCSATLSFFAPAAAAQDEAPQESAATEEAPVDVEAQQLFCPRRMGGPSARRCAFTATSDTSSYGAVSCALRYAYRGHRRVDYRPRTCQSLFPRGATSAI